MRCWNDADGKKDNGNNHSGDDIDAISQECERGGAGGAVEGGKAEGADACWNRLLKSHLTKSFSSFDEAKIVLYELQNKLWREGRQREPMPVEIDF